MLHSLMFMSYKCILMSSLSVQPFINAHDEVFWNLLMEEVQELMEVKVEGKFLENGMKRMNTNEDS